MSKKWKELTASEKKYFYNVFAGAVVKDLLMNSYSATEWVREQTEKSKIVLYSRTAEEEMNGLIGDDEEQFFKDALVDIYKQTVKLLKKIPQTGEQE